MKASAARRAVDLLWLSHNGKCSLCGRKMHRFKTINDGSCTLDHIIPRSAGGTNRLENLRLTCNKCNNTRGSGGFKRTQRKQSPVTGYTDDNQDQRLFHGKQADKLIALREKLDQAKRCGGIK